MKSKMIIIYLFFLPLSAILGQSPGSLYLSESGNKLIGNCENKYYSGFEMELDSVYSMIDSAILFGQIPRVGKVNFKNRVNIPTEFTLTQRAGYPQIMFRFNSNYLTFDNLVIEEESISFTIDDDPAVPVTTADLRIVSIAKGLLSEREYWNKNDDRNCENDLMNKSFSLYCALRIASIEVEERYNHRNAVLQKLRHLIEEKYPGRKWNHRLRDFNNMQETRYEDIVEILNEIEREFNEEVARR